jgi:hypothetical protein
MKNRAKLAAKVVMVSLQLTLRFCTTTDGMDTARPTTGNQSFCVTRYANAARRFAINRVLENLSPEDCSYSEQYADQLALKQIL